MHIDALGIFYSILFFGAIYLVGIYLPGKIFKKKKKKQNALLDVDDEKN